MSYLFDDNTEPDEEDDVLMWGDDYGYPDVWNFEDDPEREAPPVQPSDKYSPLTPCPECNGVGEITTLYFGDNVETEQCSECSGEGWV